MRLIDADELLDLYSGKRLDETFVPVPVIRQNIKDMPTVQPEKTRKEAFFELFPKASISSDGLPKSCFAVLIGQENTMCVGRGCSDCWLKPYEGEFEKAREEE